MYIESKSSKLRVVGYALIALSFLYFSLVPIFNQYVSELLSNPVTFNGILSYATYFAYLVLLTGALLINLNVLNHRSLGFMIIVSALGLPYPLLGLFHLLYQNMESLFIFYDSFAIAILFSMANLLFRERKVYRLIGILLLLEWFYFDYWIAKSGQYLFLGLSTTLTHLISLLMIIYCILEIDLEKNSYIITPANHFK